MRSRAVVVDTNVVVAGLLAQRADSPVGRLLNGMLLARFPFVVSVALLAEYRTVLLRPALATLHGLAAAEVDTVMVAIAQHAIVLSGGAPALAPALVAPIAPGQAAPRSPRPGAILMSQCAGAMSLTLMARPPTMLLKNSTTQDCHGHRQFQRAPRRQASLQRRL